MPTARPMKNSSTSRTTSPAARMAYMGSQRFRGRSTGAHRAVHRARKGPGRVCGSSGEGSSGSGWPIWGKVPAKAGIRTTWTV